MSFRCNSLAPRIDFWKKIGTPPELLEVIKHGYQLPFRHDLPDPCFSLRNCEMSQDDKLFVESEIQKMLKTEAISRVPHKPQVVSPLFVVRNTEKARLIINLSRLNESLICPRFKYEDLGFVKKIITPQGFLAKFDMKSGYHHIAIKKEYRKYLGFAWKNDRGEVEYYIFNVLPFGLSPAPFIFTKIFRPLIALWRGRGITCALYLDDGLIWAPNFEDCKENIAFVRLSLKEAGVIIEEVKSQLSPVKKLTWLGMVIDLERSLIYPTEKRVQQTMECIQFLQRSKRPTLRDRLRLTGLLSSLWLVLGPKASVYTKSIYKTVCAFKFFDAKVPVSDNERHEMDILSQLMMKPMFTSLLPPTCVFSFDCDASALALGVVKNERVALSEDKTVRNLVPLPKVFSRPLTDEEARKSSTFRELSGVLFGLHCFEVEASGAEIHVFTDNQNIIPILRKGSMVSELNELTIKIIDFLEYIGATIIPHWIPREENVVADLASRVPDKDDWAIMPHIFEKVNKILGPAEVDRFANCNNKKLERFNSQVPSPGAEAVDAFTVDWKGVINYCVPPIDLLYATVTFILKGKFPSIVGIPNWPSLPVLMLLKDNRGDWIREVTDIFRVPKGNHFLIPDSNASSMFASSFIKSDFFFVRLF